MEKISPNPVPVHKIEIKPKSKGIKIPVFLVIAVAAIIFGIVAGYIPAKLSQTSTNSTNNTGKDKAVGIADKKTFKDSVEGVLKEGGIDGEGNFHLERTGGESQNVYLTSTTVDLSTYVGKKVKVWGQTFSGEKAGWLMDVGLVETLK